MIRRPALALLLALIPSLASAQFATIGPTPLVTDNGDRLATTAWVNNFLSTGLPLASGKIFIGSVGNLATPQTMAGDCTLAASGVITCTQAAGNFNVIGNISKSGVIIPQTVSLPLTLSGAGVVACPSCVLISGTAHGDSAYSILSTDRYVYTNAAFTAARTWTLPAANSLPVGTTIWVQDAQGTVTTTNTLTIQRAGADTIDVGNTSFVISGAGGGITFTTDGVSNWGLPIQTPSTGGTGQKTLINHGVLIGAGTNPITQLGVATTGQLLFGVTGADPAFSSTGTGVPAALGINVGSAGAFVTFNGALGTPSSGTLTSATGLPISTGLTGAGTGVLTALGVNVGTAGSVVVNGGALGTPSSVGTLPAYTLGGTIAGGANQINNIVIGNSTPLAGTFTTLGSGVHTITSASSGSFAVGPSGASGSALTVDSSVASAVAGLKITGAATAGRVDISVTDPGANAGLGINAKGTGDIAIGNTSTGGITLNRATTLATVTGSAQCLHVNTSGVISGSGSDCNNLPIPFITSLGADVAMNNTANFFAGPSGTVSATGAYISTGTVTLTDTAGVAAFICKLWNATSSAVYASGRITSTGASNPTLVSLSAAHGATAGDTVQMACRDSASINGVILFNNSGLSKDSTLSSVRIQ